MQDNPKLKAVVVILRAAQAIQEVMKKDVSSLGMNTTEFAVLELLYHKGEQPIQMIGKKILISSSSITYVVDKLEQKGYVYRRACPEDRRVTFAVITDAGKQVMDQIFPEHEQHLEKIFDALSESEVREVIELCKRIGYRAADL